MWSIKAFKTQNRISKTITIYLSSREEREAEHLVVMAAT